MAIPKPCVAHPTCAVSAAIVEAAPRLNQHIKAHQEPRQMRPPVVIDQELIDDQRSTLFKRGICLADEHALGGQVPVVQDHSHDQHIGAAGHQLGNRRA